ncbi:hypothetical protein CB0940_05158 [Cercospora beticola]|uniref:Uncharacterized protein n=1 Tax=Cercospora beticola TaxID=122368 RepID=A0A2G5HNY3_CERBT|nr:hypothetical protein CB0940_05158 [Cercospora beticola]PIA93912.1 hypothetical protein CB0940_05158 [Cercospora beticola]WPB02469.1 hypothetical protein RHO25_007105 [Cercospora beticola]
MAKSKNKGRRANPASITTVQRQQTIFLDALPCEVIGMIASQMSYAKEPSWRYEVEKKGDKEENAGLSAFRLTCKTLNDSSQYEWARRHTTSIVVRLSTADIQLTTSVLANSGRFAKVKSVNFVGPKTEDLPDGGSFTVKHTTELRLSLEGFVRKLSNIEAVEVNALQNVYSASAPSPRGSSLLGTLEDVNPSKLQRLQLSDGVYSAATVHSLLGELKANLRFFKVDRFEICDGNAHSTLAFVRDELLLDELQMTAVRSVVDSEKYTLLHDQFDMGGRESKWLRNRATGNFERYTIGNCWFQAQGKGAIKLALNRILELEGSDLYDPSLTKGSLGF